MPLVSGGVVACTFNPLLVDLYKFEASLVNKSSSRTARAVIQRNPVLKNKRKKKNATGHLSQSLCL